MGQIHEAKVPPVDTSLFHNRDNPDDDQRSGACIYFGRYREGQREHAELADRCTVITKDFPATHEELAALLRRSTHPARQSPHARHPCAESAEFCTRRRFHRLSDGCE